MPYCPNCHREKRGTFCDSCGTHLQSLPTSSSLIGEKRNDVGLDRSAQQAQSQTVIVTPPAPPGRAPLWLLLSAAALILASVLLGAWGVAKSAESHRSASGTATSVAGLQSLWTLTAEAWRATSTALPSVTLCATCAPPGVCTPDATATPQPTHTPLSPDTPRPTYTLYPTYTPRPTYTLQPTYTPYAAGSGDATTEPAPTAESANTPLGSVLSVGETWRQDGLEMTLSQVKLDEDFGTPYVGPFFVVRNASPTTLTFDFYTQGLVVRDSTGARYTRWPGGDTTLNFNLAPGDSQETALDNGGGWIEYRGNYYSSSVAHVEIVLTGFGRISEARWRMAIVH